MRERLPRRGLFIAIAVIAATNVFVDGIPADVAGTTALNLAYLPDAERLFGLVMLAAVIPAGLAADRFGPRRVVLYGTALLGLGTATGLASSESILLAFGRGAQGLGTALCLPACYAALCPRRVGLFFGLCQLVFGVVGLVATTVQFALTYAANWRFDFLIVLALDALALALAFRASKDQAAHRRAIDVFGEDLAIEAPDPVRRPVWRTLAFAVALLLLLLAVVPASIVAAVRVFPVSIPVPVSDLSLCVFLCAPLLGILVDRLDALWVALTASLALATGLGVFVLRPDLGPDVVPHLAAWIVGYLGVIAFASLVLASAGGRHGFAMGACLAGFIGQKALMYLFLGYVGRPAPPFSDLGAFTLRPGFVLALAAAACAALAVSRRRTEAMP